MKLGAGVIVQGVIVRGESSLGQFSVGRLSGGALSRGNCPDTFTLYHIFFSSKHYVRRTH